MTLDSPPVGALRRTVSHPFVGKMVTVVVSWLIGASVFFYAQWSSGFNRLMGNEGDARLIDYLSEQWFLAMRGSQPWRSPPFFYPTKGALGYSDSFFLFQIFFAPFRVLGADQFLALQLTIIAMSFMGFVCFVVFVRMAFRAPLFVAIVGALVFTFANNLAGHVGDFQLCGIYFIPPIALLGLVAWRNRESRPVTSIGLGALCGLLWSLLLFSTYYEAWFTVLAIGTVAVIMMILAPRITGRGLLDAAQSSWRSLIGLAVGVGVGLIPFLLTYVPVAKLEGNRPYADAIAYSTVWQDWDNVGAGNLLYAHLLHLSWSSTSSDPYELSYAVTPILFFTVIAGGIAIAWHAFVRKHPLTVKLRFTLALCATTLLFAVLPIDTRHGSLWVVVWHIPGATAIRAIDRIENVGDVVAALALVLLASQAWQHWGPLRRSRPVRITGIVLLCLIVVEQADNTSSTQMQRNTELAALNGLPPVPAGCTSFYVVDSRPNQLAYFQFQVQAMLISQRLDIATLNGYSGNFPPRWGLTYPDTPTYAAAVKQWTAANGLTTGVCRFDLGTKSWVGHPS